MKNSDDMSATLQGAQTEQIKTGGDVAALFAAVAKAQGEMGIAVKGSVNPHWGKTYASITSLLQATLPAYNANGLGIMQFPGEISENQVKLSTMIVHAKGGFILTVASMPIPKMDPQGLGKAITYIRRYALAAAVSAQQEDDDGQGATNLSDKQAGGGKSDAPARCPKCNGGMWDNRINKMFPTSPDWKCRDKSCLGKYQEDADRFRKNDAQKATKARPKAKPAQRKAPTMDDGQARFAEMSDRRGEDEPRF